MNIDGTSILSSWICGEDEVGNAVLTKLAESGNEEAKNKLVAFEAEFSKLKEEATAGDEEAKIELAALNVENAENVTENLAFLEQAAQKGDVAANLFLGVIYSEGVVENVDTQNQKALILMDWKKSDSYLEKAIGLGSILAYSVRGMHTFLHCCCLCSQDEENDFEKTMGAPVAQDFLDGEKFLLEFIALKDDKALDEEKRAYVNGHLEMFASWLSALYECEDPVSPIYNQDKALEWTKKQKEFKKEFGD